MNTHALFLALAVLVWFVPRTPACAAGPAEDDRVTRPPARLALELKRGICLDRQFRTIPPEAIMRFTRDDIRLIKSMGFEFVKLIVNPEPLMTDHRLDGGKREYLHQIVTQVVDEGLPVVVCIHPEWEFKTKILGDRAEFAQFLLFLRDIAEFLAARWPADQLALQLMTEPVTDAIPWNELQPQMWQVARRAMPGHTLILAGDQVGRIEGLITTQPVEDENVLYSFTFYDPFLFTLQGATWLTPAWWSHLGPVPYPSSPDIIEARLPSLVDRIPAEPAEWRTTVTQHLKDYGAARWNAQTVETRIQLLDAWNKSHGGRLKIWCAEFGCYQRTVAAEDRYQYLRDVRTALEKYDIGWAYWSYNETLTVMTPDRTPFGPADRQTPDQRLLQMLK
ncbi:MAG: glycoside hydrolase family 5 protein [Planctomycetes bacterium]|nr:glycoside hydrolase family 5 protein [Planctomycetota bacterium]